MTARIETLRNHLAEQIGDDMLLRLYGVVQRLRAEGDAAGGTLSASSTLVIGRTAKELEKLSVDVLAAIGAEHEQYFPLIFQLLYCEDKAYLS